MCNSKIASLALALMLAVTSFAQDATTSDYHEVHRNQFHYSPARNWMNDPNGMLFYNGEYHLFYQHDRYEKVFGDMSWGHAVSTDLVHWTELPKAIVPDADSLGMIFSGSAVVDKDNTAGFGNDAFVAFYTSTHPQQQQSMAYSLDKGRTWTKYKDNPVIKNEKHDKIPDDFRDPKVMWHERSGKWIMSLAVKDHVEFWSSLNLKEWKKESEFGRSYGSHKGVWECPDLFELNVNGKKANKKWVLLVSMNPGGPNGGSATQYFVGDFNGSKFMIDEDFEINLSENGQWIDYGTDNYAGVTFSNIADRRIAIGWMSNWQYAMAVPTRPWRGADTFPRELKLKQFGKKYLIASEPVKELEAVLGKEDKLKDIKGISEVVLNDKIRGFSPHFQLQYVLPSAGTYSITFSNNAGAELIFGYDNGTNQYFIDRSKAGETNFENGFGKRHYAPRLTANPSMKVKLLVDAASIEVFADDGLSVMTDIFFMNKPISKIVIKTSESTSIENIRYYPIKSIWLQKPAP